MPFVYLPDKEVQRARACAVRRQAANSDPNRPNHNPDTDPYRNMHWEFRGALGELACAHFLGMEWTGENDTGADVGGRVEVRTTQPAYRLALVPKDFATHDLDTPYVSATWNGETDHVLITLRGWDTLRNLRQIMSDHEKDGHRFHLVETQDLQPMTRLKDWLWR